MLSIVPLLSKESSFLENLKKKNGKKVYEKSSDETIDD
jgi:hypothetical protein